MTQIDFAAMVIHHGEDEVHLEVWHIKVRPGPQEGPCFSIIGGQKTPSMGPVVFNRFEQDRSGGQ